MGLPKLKEYCITDYPYSFITAGNDYADIEHFVSAPFFRKKFTAAKNAKAEKIIGASGFYRLFINGKDITNGEHAPYISNPDDIVYYDRYDVSDYFTRGGESHFCIGGYLPDGSDGFNEVSYLIVESLMELPTYIPEITLRWTKKNTA